MNRLLRICILSVCIFTMSIPALFSTTVSADQNLTIYTDYYQYDNNESLVYHIVGTNNTTYTVLVLHRDSDAPLRVTYGRTDENETVMNGTIPLYEFTTWGVMELRAFNKSYNQSASCEFRLVPSHAWWTGEVDRIILDGNIRSGQYLYIIFALSMTFIVFLGVGVIRYRDKMKSASGELTVAERLLIATPWEYKGYYNDIAENNPQAQSERFHLKFKMAYWRMCDLFDMKGKMKPFEDMQKELEFLKSALPGMLQDVIDEKEAAGILKKDQWDNMTEDEKWEFLLPGEKRKHPS